MTNKLILVILSVVVVVAAGAVLAWQFWPSIPSPTPSLPLDETEDWEVFRNHEFNYEIKHPHDWELKVNFENFAHITLRKEDATQSKILMPGLVDEYINANYTIRIDVDNYNHAPDGEHGTIIIDGIDARQWSEPAAPSSGDAVITELSKDSRFYSLTYTAMAYPETHNKYIDIYNQILSTFKFIN